MKLSQCTLGKLVTFKNDIGSGSVKVGMIMGIGQNTLREAVPLVKWQDSGNHYPTHANLIKLYEE